MNFTKMTKKQIATSLIETGETMEEEELLLLTKKDLITRAKAIENALTQNPKKANTPEEEDTPKEAVPKPAPKEDEWKEAAFFSMCGFEFDPDPNSECNKLCKIDSPEEYEKCLANFKEKPVPEKTKPARKQTSGAGKNKWGRNIGSQASFIEKALDEEEPMTVAALAKYADCSTSRVRRHFLRLIHKEQQTEILVDENKLVFLPQRFPEKTGTTAYPRKTAATTQKTEPELENA